MFRGYHQHGYGAVWNQSFRCRIFLPGLIDGKAFIVIEKQQHIDQIAGHSALIQMFDKLIEKIGHGKGKRVHVGISGFRTDGFRHHTPAAKGSHGVDGAFLFEQKRAGSPCRVDDFLRDFPTVHASTSHLVGGDLRFKASLFDSTINTPNERCICPCIQKGYDLISFQRGQGHVACTAGGALSFTSEPFRNGKRVKQAVELVEQRYF